MSLYAEAQRFYALQQNPGIEGRDGRSRVTQDDGTDACDECCCACHIGKDGTVIGGVGLA